MKNRNSGLGCGCSGGSEGELGVVPMAPFLTPQSTTVSAKYTANPSMTVNPAATRQAVVAVASPAQRWRQYFQEGVAFGAAWTTGLEQGRTVPAQWSLDLERAAGTYGVPVSPTGAVPSDRDAFVAGFDAGIRIVMGSRLELMALNGRRYRLDFLQTQGRVAANTLFGQTRPAVLPIVTATSATPMAPGVLVAGSVEINAARSTADRLNAIVRAAIAANLASAAPYALEPTRVDQYNPGLRGVEWPFNVFQTNIPPEMARGLFPRWGGPATSAVLLLMGNRRNVSSADRDDVTYIPAPLPAGHGWASSSSLESWLNTTRVIRNWALQAIATASSAPAGRAAIFLPYLRAIVAAIPEQNPVRVVPR